jgi:hypothetical protein
VGVLNLPYETQITLEGNRAYVVASFSIMAIVDITDPDSPVLRSHFETSGSVDRVVVSGGMAYVASLSNGLQLVDVSDPSNPRERGAVRGFSANDVAVSGPFAYVTYAEIGRSATGLLILDVSDPDQPVERSRVELPPVAIGIGLSGSLAYIANGRAGLVILDITDPDNPQEVGGFDTPGFAFDIAVSDHLAYLADDRGGLRVIDVSDPQAPRELSFEATYSFSQVVPSGHVIYALGIGGLAIFDLGEPARPRLLTYLDSVDVFSLPFSLGVAENLLVVGDFWSVRVFDVADPHAPTEMGRYQTPSTVRGLALADGLIYVGAEGAGLLILALADVTLRAVPTLP